MTESLHPTLFLENNLSKRSKVTLDSAGHRNVGFPPSLRWVIQ